MFILPNSAEDIRFPPAHLASPEGLLAMGGDLRAERLLEAYRNGIFPWYNENQPILWWSPDPRSTLFPENLRVSRSLRKTIRKRAFEVTLDYAFDRVVEACAGPRPQYPGGGTWIQPEIQEAYGRLHKMGYAHSAEVWLNHKLVGGVYGVAIGRAFFGESMFSHETDASKIGLVYLVRQLQRWKFELIDCQVSSDHLHSLGAIDIRRNEFLGHLDRAIKQADKLNRWEFDQQFDPLEVSSA